MLAVGYFPGITDPTCISEVSLSIVLPFSIAENAHILSQTLQRYVFKLFLQPLWPWFLAKGQSKKDDFSLVVKSILTWLLLHGCSI